MFVSTCLSKFERECKGTTTPQVTSKQRDVTLYTPVYLSDDRLELLALDTPVKSSTLVSLEFLGLFPNFTRFLSPLAGSL